MSDIGTDLPHEDRLALIVLALAQSLFLLLLHKAIDHKVWPATDTQWLYASYTVALGLPLFFYFGAARCRDRMNLYAAGGLGLLLFWMGWHAGWLASAPVEDGRSDALVPGLACSLAVALFVLAFYFRTQRESGRFVYSGLMDHSWRNALTLGFLGLFLLVFWLLLWLWAGLFKAIEIDFFEELFREQEFIYPITGLVGGWGLGLIRARVGLISTVRHMCEFLIRALLPLVAFILVIFLGTLPFTGLEQLWKTGYATTLLLWLAAVLLFFFNAVVADEDTITMHDWLRRLVFAALVLLPINSALAAWAMWLRFDQYGWSVDRLWGVFVLCFIAAYSVGYAVILLKHRMLRIEALRHLNTALGMALAVALVLVNTPLCDFRRIAANNQVERLLAGRTTIQGFDARYLRFELGRYGVEKLEALKTGELARKEPQLATLIAEALAAENRWAPKAAVEHSDIVAIRARFVILPGTEVDDEFLRLLGKDAGSRDCFYNEVSCAIGALQYLGRDYLVQLFETYPHARVWRRGAGGLEQIGGTRLLGCSNNQPTKLDREAALRPLETDYFVFRHGPCLYQVLPEHSALELR